MTFVKFTEITNKFIEIIENDFKRTMTNLLQSYNTWSAHQ